MTKMFLRYYKLTSQPFGVTPDPRYLYLSPTHREAMASVLSGVMQNRGFTALIAQPGMGKTTLLVNLLQRIPNSLKTVFLFQTLCSKGDLLRSILEDLGVRDAGDSLTAMQRKLNEILVRGTLQGNRAVVLVDEAQNLDDSVLEELRILSNFETAQEKLLHVVLAGQPQLAEKLASPSMVQFRQRISVVARITPLNPTEARAYIEHRLRIAGYSAAQPLFTGSASDLIAAHSQGVPRTINTLCFNAMAVACALQRKTIGPDVIHEVLRDLDLQTLFDEVSRPETARIRVGAAKLSPMKPTPTPSRSAVARWVLATATAAVLAGLAFFMTYRHAKASNLTEPSAGPAAKAVVNNTVPAAWAEIDVPPFSSQSRHDRGTGSETDTNGATPPLAGGSRHELRIVRIKSKETLSGLCFRTLGRYDEQLLPEIRKLNPWLSNPDRIRIGQLIRLPARKMILIAEEGGPPPPIHKRN